MKIMNPPNGKILWNKKWNLDDNEWKKIYIEPFITLRKTPIQIH